MSHLDPQPTAPPPACSEAREAFALELAGGPAPGPLVRAHVAACRDCADAVARIERIWAMPAAAFPKAAIAPDSLDHLFAKSLDRGRDDERDAAPAPVVPLASRRSTREGSSARPREHRGNGLAAAIGFALAASLVAVALLMPGVHEPAAGVARATPAPTPAGLPGVRLADARGDVSFVPADGSVVPAPKKGDALEPGLFAASGGAALAIEGAGTLAVRGDATVLIGGTERAPTITIARGEIFVDLPQGTIRSFDVRTPTGNVRVTGTKFGVKVGPKKTNVQVTEGTVVVTGADGTQQAVTAGEAADLSAGGVPALVAPIDAERDPFGWVRDLAPAIAPAKPEVVAVRRSTRSVGPGEAAVPVQEVSGLDKTAIENAMEKRSASMWRCYEVALVRHPSLEVRADITFRVDEDGRAKNVRVSGVPEQHAALASCLREATRAAVFPGSAPGTTVDVKYPVQFVVTDR